MSGVDWNILSGDMMRRPSLMLYRLLMISSRSSHFLTGRNRDLESMLRNP
jgi:hypothetical protein